MYIFLKIILD